MGYFKGTPTKVDLEIELEEETKIK